MAPKNKKEGYKIRKTIGLGLGGIVKKCIRRASVKKGIRRAKVMAPKSKLEGYEILKTLLGFGASATVRKGKHIATGAYVAIKEISLDSFPIKELYIDDKKRIRREIFLGKYLKHPNIVTVYEGTINEGENAYLVMEYMEGGSLYEYVQKTGPLPEEKARKFFKQLIDGIEYCHDRYVIHRDIKPHNLLLDETQELLKITDFGCCNFLDAESMLLTFCGTRYYWAPEIENGAKDGKRYSGIEVDMFSCGATLMHILAGHPVLISRDWVGLDIYSKKMSARAIDLIQRLTAWEPKDRIGIQEIRKHEWFLNGNEKILDYPHLVLDPCMLQEILQETVDLSGCDRESVIKSLIRGRRKHVTTIYELLKKKKMHA